MTIGCAIKDLYDEEMNIKGRDLLSGLPKTLAVTTQDIYNAIENPIQTIVESVKSVLEKTPPELASDVMERGIVMTGGGALLKGLNHLVEKETGIRCSIADDPLDCVAKGTVMVLEQGYNNEIFNAK